MSYRNMVCVNDHPKSRVAWISGHRPGIRKYVSALNVLGCNRTPSTRFENNQLKICVSVALGM